MRAEDSTAAPAPDPSPPPPRPPPHTTTDCATPPPHHSPSALHTPLHTPRAYDHSQSSAVCRASTASGSPHAHHSSSATASPCLSYAARVRASHRSLTRWYSHGQAPTRETQLEATGVSDHPLRLRLEASRACDRAAPASHHLHHQSPPPPLQHSQASFSTPLRLPPAALVSDGAQQAAHYDPYLTAASLYVRPHPAPPLIAAQPPTPTPPRPQRFSRYHDHLRSHSVAYPLPLPPPPPPPMPTLLLSGPQTAAGSSLQRYPAPQAAEFPYRLASLA